MYDLQQLNAFNYSRNNPLIYIDSNGENITEFFDKGFTGLSVLGIYSLTGFLSYDTDVKYLNEFLGYSIIGTTELTYNNGSDYVEDFKKTEDYERLLRNIKQELDSGELVFSSSTYSSSSLTLYTLGKYNYSVNAFLEGDYYNVSIKITDIFDFNETTYDTFRNKGINVLHKANGYGILTPIDIEINIQDNILKDNNSNNETSTDNNSEKNENDSN